MRLTPIGQSRNTAVVGAVDKKDSRVGNPGGRDGLLNERDAHLAFKEDRISRTKHSRYSIHPIHCRLTLPNASWLMPGTESVKLGRRNANRVEEQYLQILKVHLLDARGKRRLASARASGQNK